MKRILSVLFFFPLFALLLSLAPGAADAALLPAMAGTYSLEALTDADGSDLSDAVAAELAAGGTARLTIDESGRGHLELFGEESDLVFDGKSMTVRFGGRRLPFLYEDGSLFFTDDESGLSYAFLLEGADLVRFSCTDREGGVWDESVFGDSALTMINFWEPWCQPCVNEMPDLEALYEAYAEQGFTILGVYSSGGMEEDVDAVLTRARTTYPILRYSADFDRFQTGYVPTSVFVNRAGELVGRTEIGSKSYGDWAALIRGLLASDEVARANGGTVTTAAVRPHFFTTDRGAQPWDQSVFADYELTMINFWEPWCLPCVNEMPDLERLYEAYADRGFLLLGVYSTADMESEAEAILSRSGTSYPILYYTAAFDEFQTGYVPTTIFVDRNGELIGQPEIGSKSYEEWAALIESLL